MACRRGPCGTLGQSGAIQGRPHDRLAVGVPHDAAARALFHTSRVEPDPSAHTHTRTHTHAHTHAHTHTHTHTHASATATTHHHLRTHTTRTYALSHTHSAQVAHSTSIASNHTQHRSVWFLSSIVYWTLMPMAPPCSACLHDHGGAHSSPQQHVR
eukprot:2156253-Prymnesium_polylepis.3